jgi:hypothetical protein
MVDDKTREKYREVTNNILDGILIKTSCDRGPTPIYEATVPGLAVPGVLEFAGIREPIQKISEAGLRIYGSPIGEYCGTPLEEDFFPNLHQEEILGLMKGSDPKLLGLAPTILNYHHQGIMALEGKCGFEANGRQNMLNIAYTFENKPFSPKLAHQILYMFGWGLSKKKKGRYERGLKVKQGVELKTLRALAERVKEGFQLGEYVGWS